MPPRDYIPVKYVTLTTRRGSKDSLLANHLGDVVHFLRRLKNRTNCHIGYFIGYEDEPDTHSHLIIAVARQDLTRFKRSLANKKFSPSKEWRWRHLDWRDWKPELGAKCVSYVRDKHNALPATWLCPKQVQACRKGNCVAPLQVGSTT